MDGTKTLSAFEVKDADRGEVAAVFSTFDVIDSDGDVTEPGAFEDGAAVRISAYGHSSWGGVLPVGRGVIRSTEKEAILDGEFFIGTASDPGPGRAAFHVIKGMRDLQEWSYGYDVLESGDGVHDDQKVRFLRKLKVHEVSPVLLGAGVDTRTLGVKDEKPTPTFVKEVVAVRGTVKALLDRMGSLAEVRRGELTIAKREELKSLVAALDLVEDEREELRQLLVATDPDKARRYAEREYARYQHGRATHGGV